MSFPAAHRLYYSRLDYEVSYKSWYPIGNFMSCVSGTYQPTRYDSQDLIDLRYLVGGLEHVSSIFQYIGHVIIPINELIFFRGVGIPPTSTNIYIYIHIIYT